MDFWVEIAGPPWHRFPQQYAFAAAYPMVWRFLWYWALFPPTRALTEAAFALTATGRVRAAFVAAAPTIVVSVHPMVQSLSLRVLRQLAAAEEAALAACLPGGAGEVGAEIELSPLSPSVDAAGGRGMVAAAAAATDGATPVVLSVSGGDGRTRVGGGTGHIGVTPPYVTVVTDLGGAHPMWFSSAADRLYVPSPRLAAAGEAAGVAPERIRRFGLPVRPAFWAAGGGSVAAGGGGGAGGGGAGAGPTDKAAVRAAVGLPTHLPAVLLVGGGDGVGNLGLVAKAVAARVAADWGRDGAQLAIVCGKNAALERQLTAHPWPLAAVAIRGFVTNMSEYMAACDMLVTKAGPGTIAEALIRGLPLVISGFLPGQEEGNVSLVVEAGVGESGGTPDAVASIVSRFLGDPEQLAAMAGRARDLGRPDAARQIAADIWEVATDHVAATVGGEEGDDAPGSGSVTARLAAVARRRRLLEGWDVDAGGGGAPPFALPRSGSGGAAAGGVAGLWSSVRTTLSYAWARLGRALWWGPTAPYARVQNGGVGGGGSGGDVLSASGGGGGGAGEMTQRL